MDWNDYVKSEIHKESCLSNLKIEKEEESLICESPTPIAKLSIELINKLISIGERHLIIVFPEKEQSELLLLFYKVISDIFDGQIKMTYDPTKFIKGQKLKYGNCVVRFDRIEEKNGNTIIWVKNSDLITGMPIEYAPFFQLTDTNRKLSTSADFSRKKAEIKRDRENHLEGEQLISKLIDYKTHLSNTIFLITSIGITKNLIANIKVNSRAIQDLLLIGQVNDIGKIHNVSKGQLIGEPTIVLASDLYEANEAIKRKQEIKALFIDTSKINIISNELDVLDELMKEGFPIIFLVNTVDSFDLAILESRNFSVLRWDEESITSDMYKDFDELSNHKVKNCAEQKIDYRTIQSNEISTTLSILYMYKSNIMESNASMMDIYDRLFKLTFFCLRNILILTDEEMIRNNEVIADIKINLLSQKRFIADKMYNDFNKVINNIEIIFSKKFIIPKLIEIEKIIESGKFKNICLVIADRTDLERYQIFWAERCLKLNKEVKIIVLNQNQYCDFNTIDSELTVVCGWLNKTNMKNIIFSFNTPEYIILLYDYEERWKNSHIKVWNNILHRGSNKRIFEKALSKMNVDISKFKDQMIDETIIPDEISEIEDILRENKYNKYINNGNKIIEELTEAIPVNFIGGLFAFYKTSHKLINVTEIVLQKNSDIKMMLPSELKIGDFIVVRESKHDLIKEFADIILNNSGKSDLRKIAIKWRESLETESIFSSFDEIYLKLKKVGCTKNYFTVKHWMNNEDIISPQSIEDLKYIAEAMEDEVLKENLIKVFEASKEVKRAHIQAGKRLSELLKGQIAKQIQKLGQIDPYNLWEPIEIYIDGIGTVKILKVIDIGNSMMVDAMSVNYLIIED